MTLKNSFLTDALENCKRRNWVFWISFLTFFCYFPGFLVLTLNAMKVEMPYSAPDRILKRMQDIVAALFQVNGVMPFVIIAIAILIGIQGFAYLYDKKQVNFYHSQPVKRGRRFAVLWLNGIVLFVIAYLVNMVLGMAVAAMYGCMSVSVLKMALEAFWLYFLFFLCVYHLAIVAVMLTGNTLISLCAMVVLLGYEVAARALWELYKGCFFVTCSAYSQEEAAFQTVLSPIVNLYKYDVYSNSDLPWEQGKYTYLPTMLSLIVMAVLFGVIGYVLYCKRPSESHGKSISFSIMKEPLRVLLLLLIGGFSGILIYAVSGYSTVLGILGTIFFTALGHAVIQLIYEVDFRAIPKKLPSLVSTVVVLIVLFLGFQYDITGYDSKLPKQSKVESVGIELEVDGTCHNQWIFADGREVYGREYARRMMRLTDLDTVYALLENRVQVSNRQQPWNDSDQGIRSISISFYLKNNHVEHRRIWVNIPENIDLINQIYHMEEYQAVTNQLMDENFVENYNIFDISYDNGVQTADVSKQVISQLMEVYRKDVKESHYADIYTQYPLGRFIVEGKGIINPDYINTWEIVIYPTYQHTIAFLEQQQIQPKAVYEEAQLQRMDKLEIIYHDEAAWKEAGYEGNYDDYSKRVSYTGKEDIVKILESTIPDRNTSWVSGNSSASSDYRIEIQQGSYYFGGAVFPYNQVPDFVLDDFAKLNLGEEITK